MHATTMAGAGDDLAKILGATSGFKLGRGVVGKTGQAALGVLALWIVIIWRITDSMAANGILVGIGLIATLFAVWYVRATQSFAEKNPSLALLEGAEFVAYKQLEMAAAGMDPAELKRIGDSQTNLLPREDGDAD